MRGMAREYAAGNSRGPGWHEFAGNVKGGGKVDHVGVSTA